MNRRTAGDYAVVGMAGVMSVASAGLGAVFVLAATSAPQAVVGGGVMALAAVGFAAAGRAAYQVTGP